MKRLTADDVHLIPKLSENYYLKIYARLRELEIKIAAGKIITLEMAEEKTQKALAEQKADFAKASVKKADKKQDIKYQSIIDSYNTICKSLPKSLKVNDSKRRLIKARIAEGYKFEDFEKAFINAEASDLLTGRTPGKDHENFKANFDWILKPANFCKVLENCYESTAAKTQSYDLEKFETMAINK